MSETPSTPPLRTQPLAAVDAAVRSRPSIYPEPFASRMNGRHKRVLGDLFGLTQFGVNLTTLAPGACSALRHAHSLQDEFVYAIAGSGVLWTDEGRSLLEAGDCVGFKAGTGNAHRITNEGAVDFVFLEIGDRSAGDVVTYPDDDLKASLGHGGWEFTHKDGRAY